MPKKSRQKNRRGHRGLGCLYRKKQNGVEVGFYFWKYISPIDHKAHAESTSTIDEKAAKAYQLRRLNELNMGTGRPAGGALIVTVADLYEKLKVSYRLGKNKRRGGRLLANGEFANLELHWSHLCPVFSERDVNSITEGDIERYIERRRAEVTRLGRSPSNASINRELASLRSMYEEGRELINKVPKITLLDESGNIRQGFIEDSDLKKLVGAAKEPWLKLFLTISLTYGWRLHEIVADYSRPKGSHGRRRGFEESYADPQPGVD